MAKLKLSPPWAIFYQQIKALFEKDPEIKIVYDEDEQIISLWVDNANKADALSRLLPTEKSFGAVTVKITVIPSNKESVVTSLCDRYSDNIPTLYLRAFAKNPIIDYMKTISGVFTNNLTYIVFKKEVVQYYNDSLSDIHGVCSTLYETIAKDVFPEQEGIFFCTNITADAQLKETLFYYPKN